MALHLLDHPLAGHLLAGLREKSTPPERFRVLASNLTTLLILKATLGMRTRETVVQSPLGPAGAHLLDQPLAVVPVLRAGLGMLESAVALFPDVAVGYIGLERHEDTAVARSYYSKLPDFENRFVLCLDPMLATGGSASQAIGLIKAHGAESVTMVSVVAAPEGLKRLSTDHPDVPIVAAALDDRLDERSYIVPGLGDFGDRLYGTM